MSHELDHYSPAYIAAMRARTFLSEEERKQLKSYLDELKENVDSQALFKNPTFRIWLVLTKLIFSSSGNDDGGAYLPTDFPPYIK